MARGTLRKSLFSIARGQQEDRNSVGVTCSSTAHSRGKQIGHHSYGVRESPGIVSLSRGYSYGVRESRGIAPLSRGYSLRSEGITEHRGAIERLLLRSDENSTDGR
jgi:hypothetical protein